MSPLSIFRSLLAYLRPSFLQTAAAVMGIVGGVNSLFGGSSAPSGGGYGGTPVYVPPGQSTAANDWLSTLASEMGMQGTAAGALSPAYLTALQQAMGVNQQPIAQAGAQAGAQYGDLSGYYSQLAQMLQSMGGQTWGAGQNVYNLATDPQNALYNRTAQQLQDQVRAGQAARGLGTSPEGAMEENQAMSNFNIDWQNNLLSRAMRGLTGLQKSNQLTGADLTGAAGFAGQVPGATLQSGALPVQGAVTAATAPFTIGTDYMSALAPLMQGYGNIQGSVVPYLNYGAGAGYNAANAYTGLTQLNQNTQQGGMGQLASGLGGLQSSFDTPGSWLNGLWGSGGATSDPFSSYYAGDYGGGVSSPGGYAGAAY